MKTDSSTRPWFDSAHHRPAANIASVRIMIDRIERVSALIKREISVILQEEINDPRIRGLTITHVETTRDLREAKVFYAAAPEEGKKHDIRKALRKAGGFIRGELAARVSMKYIPSLLFREDSEGRRKEHIDGIFRKIEEERER